MNRKKIFEHRDIKRNQERINYDSLMESYAATSDVKSQQNRQRYKNQIMTDRHRGDAMKDIVGYKYADNYRDQVLYVSYIESIYKTQSYRRECATYIQRIIS